MPSFTVVLLFGHTAGPCGHEQGGPASLARRLSVDADLLAFSGGVLKTDSPVLEREQRVIAPHANVCARTDRRPALSHDDRAGEHHLTVAALHAKALACAVAAVSGAAHSLLV